MRLTAINMGKALGKFQWQFKRERKQSMNLIVAVDKNWGIGKDNQLLTRISADMRLFKQLTMGNILVLGRKTLGTFPGGKPLPGRINFILTKEESFQAEEAIICHSVEEVLQKGEQQKDKEIFIAGGGSVYHQFLEYCDTAYITKIDQEFEADTFIPNLDELPEWTCIKAGEWQEENGISFQFCIYQKKV